MGTFSIWHWLIVLAVVLLLFGGRGKISQIMGDFGKGLKSFKKNVKDDGASSEDDDEEEPRRLHAEATEARRTAEDAEAAPVKKDKAANG